MDKETAIDSEEKKAKRQKKAIKRLEKLAGRLALALAEVSQISGKMQNQLDRIDDRIDLFKKDKKEKKAA